MISLENKLKNLYLQKHEIEEEIQSLEEQISQEKQKTSLKTMFTKDEKINIFKSLFVARSDIYAKKWVSKDGSKQGFYPVTRTFQGEDFIPLTNKEIENHLRGLVHLATFCIDSNNMSKFLVFEILDEDKFKLQIALNSINIRAYYELNSYNSLIAWIFLEESMETKVVYNFGKYLLKKAKITAKMYPNNEFANNSNLGLNLELPLHLKSRNKNKTVFIDTNTNKIYEDQWMILNSVQKVSKQIVYENVQISKSVNSEKDFGNIEFPIEEIEIVLYDFLYIPISILSKSLINKLKSFASFENPQIKVLLSLRKPLYNTPRVIQSFEEDNTHLMLPRGLKNIVCDFFNSNGVKFSIDEKRYFNACKKN